MKWVVLASFAVSAVACGGPDPETPRTDEPRVIVGTTASTQGRYLLVEHRSFLTLAVRQAAEISIVHLRDHLGGLADRADACVTRELAQHTISNGAVRFTTTIDARGTIVELSLQADPPSASKGALLCIAAPLRFIDFGQSTSVQRTFVLDVLLGPTTPAGSGSSSPFDAGSTRDGDL